MTLLSRSLPSLLSRRALIGGSLAGVVVAHLPSPAVAVHAPRRPRWGHADATTRSCHVAHVAAHVRR